MKTFETFLIGILIVTVENINNGISTDSVGFYSLLAIISCVLIVISKNPIMSVLFLIGLFVCVSIILSLLGLTFVALAYLLVYVGAVSILFLFILMLINVRISELSHGTSNSILLAIISLISLGTAVYSIFPEAKIANIKISLVTCPVWDALLAESNHIASIGNIIYTSYNIWLIISGIILLLAMVGAIAITMKSE